MDQLPWVGVSLDASFVEVPGAGHCEASEVVGGGTPSSSSKKNNPLL